MLQEDVNSKGIAVEIPIEGEGYADNAALDLRLDLEHEIEDREIGVILDSELDDGRILIWFVVEREEHMPLAAHRFAFLLQDFAIDAEDVKIDIFDI